MKKILILLSVTLLLTLSISPVSAISTTTEKQENNEFLMVKDSVQELKIQLKNEKPMTTQYVEISKKINEYGDFREKFISHKKQLNLLTSSELKVYGYNDAQINAIRSDSETDEILALSSATLTGSLTEYSYTYNATTNTTKYKVRYYGSWNGMPIFQSTDNIAVAIAGNGDHYFYAYSSSSCNLKYQGIYNGVTYTEDISVTEVTRDGSGVVYKAPLNKTNTQVPLTSLYLKNFTVYLEGQMQDNVTISEASAIYGHRTLSIAPTIGITIAKSPSVGISFTLAWGFEPVLPKILSSTNY